MARSLRLTFVFATLLVLLWLISWQLNPIESPILPSAGLLIALIVLAWFDIDHYRIPDWISYPLIISGLVLAYTNDTGQFLERVLGAIVGFSVIWALNAYWRWKFGKDGIGLGDAKLLSGAGAWLGVFALAPVTLIASGGALLLLLAMRLFGKAPALTPDQHIPFGPFIACGFWAAWVF